jgi:DNA-directed RNA polymerase specialized sigma24 family protein
MAFSFEDKKKIIDEEIAKRRGRWKLKAIPSMDFDDVSQILRIHIWKKWHLWDQTRPLEPWLNKVITHQITNLIRNLYGNFARPCLNCAANQGGDLCAIFGKQCSLCPLYAHWEKHKKPAHDTKLPVPLIGTHEQEVFNIPQENSDLLKQVQDMHGKMKLILTAMQYRIYDLLYIQGKTEDEVAKVMGYRTSEANRKAGYKQLPNIKKIILQQAKKIIEKEL